MRADADRRERIKARVEEKLRPLTLPNFLTLIRMAIVPFFVIAVFNHDFRLAVWTFAVAGVTDLLDGWLARRLEVTSVIGAYLDPLADKILLTAAYISLAIPHGQQVAIPMWLAILALFRDFLLMLMAFVFYMVEGVTSFPPSVAGKATTLVQVVTVGVVLLANVLPVPEIVPQSCFYASFVLVIVSGFNYIYRASRAIEIERQARAGADPDSVKGEIDDQGDRRR